MRILLFIAAFSTFYVNGQQVWNTTAGAAQFVSSASSSVHYDFDQPECVSQVKLYFYYKSAVTLTPVLPAPQPQVFNGSANTGAINCAVKVWGPYATKAAADADYLSATPLVNNAMASTIDVKHHLITDKIYLMEVTVNACEADFILFTESPGQLQNNWEGAECVGCITGFRPSVGKYILSAWVKDADAQLGSVTYSEPAIKVTSGGTPTTCTPAGEIIDGWQRIEQEIDITTDEECTIELKCDEGDCYFDDIRIFPKDGSMVTYVYDPLTLRLMAELDERNYAKIYEYDESGKLVRVKKETEMGVMTIQESRENNSKE